MPRKDALQLLKVLKRLKSEHGIAYISTPRALPFAQRTKNRQEFHVHEYTYEELREDLLKVFSATVILGQLDERVIGSLIPKNVWNYFAINY